jgi:hypothetical protein
MNSTGVQEITGDLSIVAISIHAIVGARVRRSGVRHIATSGVVYASPLRMVENVETLGAEL